MDTDKIGHSKMCHTHGHVHAQAPAPQAGQAARPSDYHAECMQASLGHINMHIYFSTSQDTEHRLDAQEAKILPSC